MEENTVDVKKLKENIDKKKNKLLGTGLVAIKFLSKIGLKDNNIVVETTDQKKDIY